MARRVGRITGLLDADILEFVVANGRKGTDLRTPDDVLADLDRLRDRRTAKTVTEIVYHDEQDRLWEELREIDRLEKQRQAEETRLEKQLQAEAIRIEQEAAKQRRRDQRIARSQRRLDALRSQPPRHNTAELRRWLEAFIKIDSSNQPDVRARQRRVEERLKKLTSGTHPQKPTTKPQLSEADRLRRRAVASGDAAKAVEIARRFHEFVKRLYVSQRAEIRYGPGGEQEKDWSRSSRFPKVWKNAGVSIDYATEQIVFENHKGELKSRLSLPPMKQVTFDGLEDGDLWGVFRLFTPHVIERWGLDPRGVTVVRGYSQR
jgi:hypothetical protein